MKLRTKLIAAGVLALALSTGPGAMILQAATCIAPRPPKPPRPPGCKDLVLQCLCDQRGQNCGWTWICTR